MNNRFIKSRYGVIEDTIRISREMLSKVVYILENKSSLSSNSSLINKLENLLNDNKDNYEIDVIDFLDIEKELTDSLTSPFYLGEELSPILSKDPEFDELSKPFFAELKSLHEELKKHLYLDYYFDRIYKVEIRSDENNLLDEIKTIINIFYEYKIVERDYYKLRDLVSAKNYIFDSLKSFCDELTVNKIETDFNKALNDEKINVNKVQDILEKAQKLILNHWKTYLTDVNSYESGKDFKFICHSMRGLREFSGDFDSRYISCSLLSEKVMGTFNRDFGFIFDSEHIVGADSKDMYVKNYNPGDEVQAGFSILPNLKGPELIIQECIERQEEEKKKDEKDRRVVYNEVVIDGFNPIGIFVLTDGSKELDFNYVASYELSEKFPELKVIEIDKTLYLSNQDLFDVRKGLINRIESRLGYETSHNDDVYFKCYDMFWNKYLELKKSGEYTIDQIIELYNQNRELLFTGVNFDDLLDKYTDEQIEVILKSNYLLKIKFILEGDYKFFCFEDVYNYLKKYAGDIRLDKYVPGLSTFLRVFPTVKFSDEEKAELCKFNNFNDINNYIINKRNSKFKERIETPKIINIDESLNNKKKEEYFDNLDDNTEITL